MRDLASVQLSALEAETAQLKQQVMGLGLTLTI